MTYNMIDVSQFQGNIAWQEVKAAGYNYAMIRVGGRFGNNGRIYRDEKADVNIKNALAAGLKIGLYFFSQAVNAREGKEEADFTIQYAKKYNIELPLAIDTEYLAGGRHNLITRQQRTDAIEAFCKRVKEEGRVPMIYGGIYWFADRLDMSRLKGIDIWLAQWAKKPSYKGEISIWQYADNGKVPGIKGNVDMNYLYKEYWKGNSEPTPEPPKEDVNLKLTGKLDKETVTALQKWMKTYQDGIISGQHPLNKKYVPACTSVTWEGTGSKVIMALQKFLNGKGFNAGAVDGLIGPKTIKALQKYLNKSLNYNLDVDGYLGPKTAKALQEHLNLIL